MLIVPLLGIPVLLGGGYALAKYLSPHPTHPGVNPNVSATTTDPVPTPDGGSTFAVVVPSTGYTQAFKTAPVPPGTIAVPTTNLTTGAAFDQITLASGSLGDIAGATVGLTDFLLVIPGNGGGGIASVASSNTKVIPSVPTIPKAGQAQALDIGAPLAKGTANLQVSWFDAAGNPQNTTFSIATS